MPKNLSRPKKSLFAMVAGLIVVITASCIYHADWPGRDSLIAQEPGKTARQTGPTTTSMPVKIPNANRKSAQNTTGEKQSEVSDSRIYFDDQDATFDREARR